MLFQPLIASCNSCSAPTKLVPLSDLISSGGPLRLTNCRKAIMKSSVSNDGTSSRKTARIVKQLNKHPQRFAEPRPHLTISGPKKSTPENVKGGLYGCNLSLGRGAMTCFIGLSFIQLAAPVYLQVCLLALLNYCSPLSQTKSALLKLGHQFVYQ